MTCTARYVPQDKERTCKHDPESFVLQPLRKLFHRAVPEILAPLACTQMEYLASTHTEQYRNIAYK